MTMFPRTEVGGVSLPRMLAGTNWILGYSHTGPAADEMIKRRHADPKNVAAVMDAYMGYGIDAVMGPSFDEGSSLRQGMRLTEEKFGRKMIQIVTPGINVDNNEAARKEAEVERKKAKVDLSITAAKASADIAAAIAAAVLTAAAGGEAYTVAVRIAAAVAAVLSAGAAVASAAAKIGNIPAFERGGEAKRGLVFRAGERGYEVGEGVSGRSYLFPRDAVYMAPEPMRIHPHSDSVQMVNNYNKQVTLRNSLTVKVIDNKRIEKYFGI